MKLSHISLAVLWVFMTTVEAQDWGTQPRSVHEGFGPDQGYSEPAYLRPRAPRSTYRYRRPREVLIYQHPDDGLPSEAPYISVPTNDYWEDPFQDPW